MTPEEEKLIVKFLINQSSANELDELSVWIQNGDNKKRFDAYIRTNYAIDSNLQKFNPVKVKLKLLELIEKDRKSIKLKRIRKIAGYATAAIVVGVLVSNFLFKTKLDENTKDADNTQTITSIKPGINKAILTLDDGLQVILENGTNYQTQMVNSNGNEIVYVADKEKRQSAIKYNYITIPRGGEFFVRLSDGTQVWLNSETQLKYPVLFVEGQDREVELVYGEAYFDVSPSTEHQGTKFKVFNNEQEVKVLGTEFNIKAYKDEANIYTTLVEGKVAVSFDREKYNLTPGQQMDLDLETKNGVLKVVDVYNEISWKEGAFSFERKSLKEIMKVLSRWYDFEVVFETKDIEKKRFIGVLGKDQNIDDILNTIKGFGNINDYEIKDKTIILK